MNLRLILVEINRNQSNFYFLKKIIFLRKKSSNVSYIKGGIFMSKIIERKMEDCVYRYKKCLSHCIKDNKGESSSLMFYDSNREVSDYFSQLSETTSPEKRYILRVNFALSCMDMRASKILWKEYFFQIEKYWWMRLYTRSTFYRLRKKAIEEFLCYMG